MIYCNLAALCGMRGDNKEMIKLLQHALKLKPDFSITLRIIGANVSTHPKDISLKALASTV